MIMPAESNNGNGKHPLDEQHPLLKKAEENPLAPEVAAVGTPVNTPAGDPLMVQIDPRLVRPPGDDRPFIFPGHDGLPFRGNVPDLKDADRVQPQIGNQVFVKVLDLADEKDMKQYQQICQAVGNHFAQISFEERRYDPETKNWRVLIRWMLQYTHMPSESGSLFM